MRSTIFVILCVVVLAGCSTSGTSPHAGAHAPDFALTTLDGRQIPLSELKGKVVVLDFWATWCAPCRQGLPHLQSLAANADMAQRGLTVLAVNEQEKLDAIRPFMDKAHYSFTVLLDTSGSAAQAYGVSALPTTIVIGRDGLVQAGFSGWTQDSAHQIDDAVSHALDAPTR